jgi:hypothetical protein
MVIIGLVYGTAQAFFQPAYTGLVPQTVAERDIQAAQALGARSAGLECGGTSEAELRAAGATWVFRDPERLCQALAEVSGPGREAWPA